MLQTDMGEKCAGTAPKALDHQALTEILAAVLNEIAAMRAMVEPSVWPDVLIEAAVHSEARPQEQVADNQHIGKDVPNRQESEDKPRLNVLGHFTGELAAGQARLVPSEPPTWMVATAGCTRRVLETAPAIDWPIMPTLRVHERSQT